MDRFHSRSPADFGAEAAAGYRLLSHLRGSADHDIALFPDPDPDSAWLGELDVGALAPGQGELTVYTSGTTGKAKARRHAIRNIFARPRRGDAADRWLLCYSPSRWAGLSVTAHAVATGAELVLPRSLATSDLARALPLATHVSLTPSLLRKLAGAAEVAAPGMKQVTLGGEWASQASLDLAKAMFPNARVSHVYASTEFGDICAASDGVAGFPVERIANGSLSSEGELLIDGVATGDLWEIRDGRYHFRGRAVEQISVGGALVAATVVEDAALTHPAVVQARAFGIANAVLGQAIAMEYVGAVSAEALKAHLALNLPRLARPMRLTQVGEIALSPTGKITRERRP